MTEPGDRNKLAEKLKTARTQAGLSQQEVANLLGLKRPAISEIEAGRRNVRAEELNRLADIYHVRAEWLLSEDRDELSPKIEIAARKLANLKADELDQILTLLDSLKDAPPPKDK